MTATGADIITLDPDGDVHVLALVRRDGEVLSVVVRGDPPARFVHRDIVWCATGKMIQPEACPLSEEYQQADELS